MTAGLSRTHDWRHEEVPASRQNVSLTFVSQKDLRRIWALEIQLREGSPSSKFRSVLTGGLVGATASAAIEQLLLSPVAASDATISPGSPLQQLTLQGGMPLEPPFETIGTDDPTERQLADLRARIASGDAPALTRRGVARTAFMLQQAYKWSEVPPVRQAQMLGSIKHLLDDDVVPAQMLQQVSSKADVERSQDRSSGSLCSRSSRRRTDRSCFHERASMAKRQRTSNSRSHSRDRGKRRGSHSRDRGRRDRSRSRSRRRGKRSRSRNRGKYDRSRSRSRSRSQHRDRGVRYKQSSHRRNTRTGPLPGHIGSVPPVSADAADQPAADAASSMAVEVPNRGPEAPQTPSPVPVQQRFQAEAAQQGAPAAAAQHIMTTGSLRLLTDHNFTTGRRLVTAPPCVQLLAGGGGTGAAEPLDHMVEYLEGMGEAAEDDAPVAAGHDDGACNQVWAGSLAWPATKAALRAENCAASIVRFGGASAGDRAGPAWVRQAGSDMAARGLALLLFTDEEHLPSLPELSVSSVADVSDPDAAWRQLAHCWEGSVLIVAGEADAAAQGHQLLRPWIALAAALRTRKQAASVRLGLQIDGQDRFFRLLLLPPPRPTDHAPQLSESPADKLLAMLPEADRASLDSYVAAVKGKAADQQQPARQPAQSKEQPAQQPAARQAQRGHMLAMLCVEPGAGGTLSRPMAVQLPSVSGDTLIGPEAVPSSAAAPAELADETLQAAASPMLAPAVMPSAHPVPLQSAAAAPERAAQSADAGTAEPPAQAAEGLTAGSPSAQHAAQTSRGGLVLGSGVAERLANVLQQHTDGAMCDPPTAHAAGGHTGGRQPRKRSGSPCAAAAAPAAAAAKAAAVKLLANPRLTKGKVLSAGPAKPAVQSTHSDQKATAPQAVATSIVGHPDAVEAAGSVLPQQSAPQQPQRPAPQQPQQSPLMQAQQPAPQQPQQPPLMQPQQPALQHYQQLAPGVQQAAAAHQQAAQWYTWQAWYGGGEFGQQHGAASAAAGWPAVQPLIQGAAPWQPPQPPPAAQAPGQGAPPRPLPPWLQSAAVGASSAAAAATAPAAGVPGSTAAAHAIAPALPGSAGSAAVTAAYMVSDSSSTAAASAVLFDPAAHAAAPPASALPLSTMTAAAAPAALLPPLPAQDTDCLPYTAPDCSRVREALRNRVVEHQEAIVEQLAAAQAWTPVAALKAACPLPAVLQKRFPGEMQGFMEDEGCAALLAWGNDARSLVAATAGAVRSVRLRRRVLDLCYSGVAVTCQTFTAKVKKRFLAKELRADCADLLSDQGMSSDAFLELLNAELGPHLAFLSFTDHQVYVEPRSPPVYRRTTLDPDRWWPQRCRHVARGGCTKATRCIKLHDSARAHP